MKKSKNHNSNDRIRELLALYQMSQTEFCEKTGITKSALSNYLNGDRLPRQDQLSKISEAFDVNPAWLMGYDVPMNVDAMDPLAAQRTLRDVAKNPHRIHAELLQAAQGCTDDQIRVVIQTLKAFKESNKRSK